MNVTAPPAFTVLPYQNIHTVFERFVAMNVTMSLLRCLHSATVADLNALVAASGLTYRDAKAAAEGLVADGLARRASPYGS